jgi:hypothetical protein
MAPSVVVTSFWGPHPPAVPCLNGGSISHVCFPSDSFLDLHTPLPLDLGSSSPFFYYPLVCFSFPFCLYSCFLCLFYLFITFLSSLSFYFIYMFLLSPCPAVGGSGCTYLGHLNTEWHWATRLSPPSRLSHIVPLLLAGITCLLRTSHRLHLPLCKCVP